MPYAIKCLLDIQEDGRAVLLIFQGLEDVLYYSMKLLWCTKVMPEAKLMITEWRSGVCESRLDDSSAKGVNRPCISSEYADAD
ncbi:GH22377 [Drosophila grimshawi]|uniref:GH22377 n=1 Tax=Drosophila grimshawi TaxID=7222 RepID=B4JYW4_DROGR|nr:GH22377 [Drosophila grimshawi]